MTTLTIDQQIHHMRSTWPGFTVLGSTRWMVGWEGNVRPIRQTYLIRVWYCRGFDLGMARIRPYDPSVTVMHPVLRTRASNPSERIPHLYQNIIYPQRPILCLFDPCTDEWHPDLAIADTTIPWAIDWLACYEGWLVTGEWTGGGRHPSITR